MNPPFVRQITFIISNQPNITYAEAITMWGNHIIGNLEKFFVSYNPTDFRGLLLWEGQKAQIFIITIWSLLITLRQFIIKVKHKDPQIEYSSFPFFNFLLFLILILSSLVYYNLGTFRDYRIYAPYLLMAIIIIILVDHEQDFDISFGFNKTNLFWLKGKHLVVFSVIALNIIMVPGFFLIQKEARFHINHFNETISIKEFQDDINGIIEFKKGANPWCNTILLDSINLTNHSDILGIPNGFGISFILGNIDLSKIQSKYVLINNIQINELVITKNLRFVTKTNLGDLYINRNTKCKK
ncbi:MAG: hypothetical protein OEZ01_16325 [Candidatus Heimdallarchaeota archaeon]|nr:hypothetical protein [Candidatus Heimdallarchaeota archaeon]